MPISVALQQSKVMTKIENVQKRREWNIESGYPELLQKSNETAMTTRRLRSLCTKIYKRLNDLNPGFMSSTFKLSSSNRAACK